MDYKFKKSGFTFTISSDDKTWKAIEEYIETARENSFLKIGKKAFFNMYLYRFYYYRQASCCTYIKPCLQGKLVCIDAKATNNKKSEIFYEIKKFSIVDLSDFAVETVSKIQRMAINWIEYMKLEFVENIQTYDEKIILNTKLTTDFINKLIGIINKKNFLIKAHDELLRFTINSFIFDYFSILLENGFRATLFLASSTLGEKATESIHNFIDSFVSVAEFGKWLDEEEAANAEASNVD